MNVLQIALILSTTSVISGAIKNFMDHGSREMDDTKTMEEALLIFFEEFRCRMRMVDENLPTLDPFMADFMAVELDDELGYVTGELTNLRIDGLSDFVVNDLEFNFDNLDFWIDATLPELSLAGAYDIDGIFGGMLGLFGYGNFSIVLTEMHMTMNATIAHDGVHVTWDMPKFQMNFHLGTLTTNIENLFNDDELSDFFNLAFTTLGSEIVDVVFPEIEPQIADAAKQMTPDMLNGVTIYEFLDIIFLVQPFLPDLPDGETCEYEINYPRQSRK